MTTIQAPTNCPSCDSVLEWKNHLLYCKNPSCHAKIGKSIEHFAKTIKIKGLGPATIAKLGLNDIADIYLLSEEEIADRLSSEVLAEKLFYEIENSRSAPLNMLLPAFGISLIGRSAAEKLSTTCETIFDIDETVCGRAGLGPKATENLLTWLENEFPKYQGLQLNFAFKTNKIDGKALGTVCISGKLKSYKTKAEAAKVLESKGYKVKPSVTKEVTILVNESGIESAKTKRARESGITIIENLKAFLGEKNGNT